jgi:hypothetical protein
MLENIAVQTIMIINAQITRGLFEIVRVMYISGVFK